MLPVSRIRIISVVVAMVAVCFLVRLYILQVIRGENYSEIAAQQYTGGSSVLYDRGSIFFQHSDGSLLSAATLRTGYTIAISPKNIKDAKMVYDAVSKIISIDSEDFFLRAGKKDDPYEEIALKVSEEHGTAIKNLKLTGVQAIKTRWRAYPGETLASSVLGMVGRDGVPLGYGLESFYNSSLFRDKKNTYSNFFVEIFSTFNKVLNDKQALEGDIITTIEPEVEQFLEQQLQKIQDEYKSKSSGGIIINPQNGEIYAMGTLPSFNPNDYSKSEITNYNNSAVMSRFEMGSIIKPLTMAAGIDTGVVTAKTTYNDTGSRKVDGFTISNFDKKARGIITMQDVLNNSLNLGVSFVVEKLGINKFSEYFRNYALGEKTGIDIPGEITGDIANLKSNRNIEHFTASFGQGIALTPIETARALCVLGNGGYLIQPHIVKQIKYDIGTTKNNDFNKGKQVIKTETSEEISRMLVTVVDTSLKGGIYKNPRYSVCAKTGTAQIAKPGGGGYYEDKYLHSFFGYFPAFEPKYLVLLYTIEPQGVQYATDTLTKPYMNIQNFLIKYYQVPPDR